MATKKEIIDKKLDNYTDKKDTPMTEADVPRIWSGKNLIKKFKNKKMQDKRYHIIMNLRNGDRKQLYIFTDKQSFIYSKGEYILNTSEARYDHTAKSYSLEYWQDFSLPIKVNVDLSELRKAVKKSSVTDLDIAFNPFSLADFGRSKVVEGMMQGQGLQDWIKRIFTMLVITLIVVIIHLLLFAQKSGMLEQVTGAVGI